MSDSRFKNHDSRQQSDRLKQWIADRYGSRRGFVKTLLHKLLYAFGRYRAYRQIDWDSVERLVFVCKGNICRSAYAEVIARSFDVETISCGIDTRDGLSANANAIQAATVRGKDLSNHKTTPLSSLVINKGDLFLAMEPWQVEYLENELEKGYAKSLLGIWSDNKRPHIQDPYGASETYFNNCFEYIEESVHEICFKVRK
jgi:protein-tyrosine phosphatase